MTSKIRYSRPIRKLLNAALSVSIAFALSACTKAQLIGTKQLTNIKFFSVQYISPASGPKAGGTTITLVGTGFVSGMTVSIGGIPCTSVTVVSTLLASCVTGSSPIAATDTVTVVNGDGQTNAKYTYAYLGTLNATATRIASGGNINSTGGAGGNQVTARTTVGALVHKTGNISTGGAGASQVTVRGGVIGVFSLH
jgi:hypothetical protein